MASNKPQDPNLNAPDIDTSTGTAADVEAVMRKFDRESNTRVWEGKPKLVVGIILAAFSLFCIYVTLFANFLEQVRMTSFMGLVIIMGFLTYPAKKGYVKVNSLPWYDIVLMLLGAGAFFFYTFNAHAILNMRLKELLTNPFYTAVAVVGIVVLAELCRRSVGLPILCVAIFFIGYTFLNGKTLSRTAYEMFYGDNGILGTPVSVCSKYIVVFIIFGAFLEKTGVSSFFINLANSLTGRFAGGPAKVAVISSALCGMVSGSSVGNTVTTGSVTIPMMKKTGYRSEFAGAVEAAASTGGQIMPPIMGAAAFLMADYLGVPYSNIIVRAIVPAVLYFLGIFIAVHLEAKKLGLKGIDPAMLPRFKSPAEGHLPAAAADRADLAGVLQHPHHAVLRRRGHRGGHRGGLHQQPDRLLQAGGPEQRLRRGGRGGPEASPPRPSSTPWRPAGAAASPWPWPAASRASSAAASPSRAWPTS